MRQNLDDTGDDTGTVKVTRGRVYLSPQVTVDLSPVATKMNEKAEIVATMAENVRFISRSGNENE